MDSPVAYWLDRLLPWRRTLPHQQCSEYHSEVQQRVLAALSDSRRSCPDCRTRVLRLRLPVRRCTRASSRSEMGGRHPNKVAEASWIPQIWASNLSCNSCHCHGDGDLAGRHAVQSLIRMGRNTANHRSDSKCRCALCHPMETVLRILLSARRTAVSAIKIQRIQAGSHSELCVVWAMYSQVSGWCMQRWEDCFSGLFPMRRVCASMSCHKFAPSPTVAIQTVAPLDSQKSPAAGACPGRTTHRSWDYSCRATPRLEAAWAKTVMYSRIVSAVTPPAIRRSSSMTGSPLSSM